MPVETFNIASLSRLFKMVYRAAKLNLHGSGNNL